MKDSNYSSNWASRNFLKVRRISLFIGMVPQFTWKKDFFSHMALPLKTLRNLMYVFDWFYFMQCVMSLFFVICHPILGGSVFDTVSSKKDRFLFYSTWCVDIFVFVDINIHYKDWLTDAGGTKSRVSDVIYFLQTGNKNKISSSSVDLRNKYAEFPRLFLAKYKY